MSTSLHGFMSTSLHAHVKLQVKLEKINITKNIYIIKIYLIMF
jgi:hypothetical protein